MKHYTYALYLGFQIRTEHRADGGFTVTYAPVNYPARRYVMEIGDSPQERRYYARRVIEAGACELRRRASVLTLPEPLQGDAEAIDAALERWIP